jgi:hypothetical protein
VANAVHQLHELDIASGDKTEQLEITARAPNQVPSGQQVPTFFSPKQKQRAALQLTTVNTGDDATKVLLVGCGMTHEKGDPAHGWLMAFELGLYDVLDPGGGTAPPKDGDHPESIVKLNYIPAAGEGKARLEPVAWFTPFQDSARNQDGVDDFQDYDLGSAGPVPLPGMTLVVGAGTDGVLYVLDTDTAGFGKGSDFSKLKHRGVELTLQTWRTWITCSTARRTTCTGRPRSG